MKFLRCTKYHPVVAIALFTKISNETMKKFTIYVWIKISIKGKWLNVEDTAETLIVATTISPSLENIRSVQLNQMHVINRLPKCSSMSDVVVNFILFNPKRSLKTDLNSFMNFWILIFKRKYLYFLLKMTFMMVETCVKVKSNLFGIRESLMFELLLHQRWADSESGTSYDPSSYPGISLKTEVYQVWLKILKLISKKKLLFSIIWQNL